MILTDREIQSALNSGQISIDPRPEVDAYSSTSVDLTLLDNFTVWRSNPGITIRPGKRGHSYSHLATLQESRITDQYELRSMSFVLAWTKEIVTIPNSSRLAARVEGKSSIARIGISVHITAPTVHSGFTGPIQLEMFNFGPHDVVLDAGMRICQLIFEQTLGTPDKGYQGAFLNQAPRTAS
ncbi:MAG: dCTP deaminase [Gemmatimonadaceae bacterium]|nr:dCTP deaminase [Acetobacteraceae bacterium]